MIINISRAQLFNQCKEKMRNWDVQQLRPAYTPEPLATGGAYHAGIAHFFTTRDVKNAVRLTEEAHDAYYAQAVLLPEEKAELVKQKQLAVSAVEQYAIHYKDEPFEVLFPEVEFCVELPNSLHHCYFAHRLIHPDVPFEECASRLCRIPHRFKGRTDAVVAWSRLVWLLEHKTSAQKQNFWWDQWLLDMQCTGYMYGIWKATGTRPHGVIVNKIIKPQRNAVNQTVVGFEREPYLRTEADLLRFEKEITLIASEYERHVANDIHYMNTSACMDYNRRCYFMDMCLNHRGPLDGEFIRRDLDYVELEYYKILGIPLPGEKEVKVEPKFG